jgi:Domain of unknown function (DUF4328)
VTPPPRAVPPQTFRRPFPYTGPPSYPVPPRWGFPQLTWRWPVAVSGRKLSEPVERLRALARNAVVTLWLATCVLVVSAFGEGWRFVLLLLSRDGALSRHIVSTSDAVVVTAGIVSALSAACSVVFGVLWVVRARQVAAKVSGQVPARSTRKVVCGLLVPVLNLVMAGSVLAELEHAAGRRPVSSRPTPSRLLLWWWGAWALGQVLFVITLLMLLDTSVQGMANGIELHLAADLVAAFVTGAGAVLIGRITTQLEPVDLDSLHRLQVVKVIDAPEPPLRSSRASGSIR